MLRSYYSDRRPPWLRNLTIMYLNVDWNCQQLFKRVTAEGSLNKPEDIARVRKYTHLLRLFELEIETAYHEGFTDGPTLRTIRNPG